MALVWREPGDHENNELICSEVERNPAAHPQITTRSKPLAIDSVVDDSNAIGTSYSRSQETLANKLRYCNHEIATYEFAPGFRKISYSEVTN